jgi:hypothetical protein
VRDPRPLRVVLDPRVGHATRIGLQRSPLNGESCGAVGASVAAEALPATALERTRLFN